MATIPRSATFAWSPASLAGGHTYLATGTLSGALDESFSNDSKLELWDLFTSAQETEPQLKGSVSVAAKFAFPNSAFLSLTCGQVHEAGLGLCQCS